MSRRQSTATADAAAPRVAAATRIKQTDPKLAKRQSSRRAAWQGDAWAYFDLVGEVKQAVTYSGNVMAKVRFFVATTNPEDPEGPPIPVDADASPVDANVAAQAKAELERLKAGVGGHAHIVRPMSMNLDVAGEGYLVGRAQRIDMANAQELEPETWKVYSISQVELKALPLPDAPERRSRFVLKLAPDAKQADMVPLDPELDTVIRFWTQHPQWSDLPDAPLNGCLGECETLHLLSQQLQAEAKSRLGSGILKVPNEISFEKATPASVPDDGDEATSELFIDALVEALIAPIEQPDSAAGIAPLVVRAQAEHLQHMDKLDLSRHTGKELDDRIEKRIVRLARGLNLPPERVLGFMGTTYANADQVDEDEFEDYHAPKCTLLADTLTVAYLRPQLADAGIPPDAAAPVFVWFDASALFAQPDPAEHADYAHDNLLIADRVWREQKGYSEEDAPDAVEVLIRTGLKRGILTADLTAALIQQLADEAGVELPSAAALEGGAPAAAPAATTAWQQLGALLALRAAREGQPEQQVPATTGLPARASLPAPAPVVAAARRPALGGVQAGRKLVAIDQQLRSQWLVLADRTVTRALERAGSVVRTKVPAVRELTRTVRTDQVVATAGRAALAAAGLNASDLVAESLQGMERQFMEWGATAQHEALNLASQLASGLTTAERTALEVRQAADLAEAWAWTRDALTNLAEAQLFDPVAGLAEVGEVAAGMRIPAALMRQAMARAGGATSLSTTNTGGAYVALTANGGPLGGIGTGDLVLGTITDHGGSVGGYVWDYGPGGRKRPFEPHASLDGVEFANFDDEVLTNTSGWPDSATYMPGDHDGCLCDFVPLVSGAEGEPV